MVDGFDNLTHQVEYLDLATGGQAGEPDLAAQLQLAGLRVEHAGRTVGIGENTHATS